jgi:hypothetical protein
MKKAVLTIALFLFAIALMAQVPAGFSYQAVVRNNSGEIVANKTVKFRFSILKDTETGTSVYVETHSVPTNAFGLANMKVGMGTKVSGNFDVSAWGANKHFMKVELDPNNGNTFAHLGTTQLLAVPYAFHSGTAESIPDNSVTSAKIADGTIATADLANNSVTSVKIATNAVTEAKIAAGAVTGAKIAQAGATGGQVLKWNGTAWAPAADATGSSESVWQTTGDNVYRSTGKVGIGTSAPAAQLHVQGTAAGQGNILFAGSYKTSNPGEPPASGEGTRLMWYPDKAALRAGYVGGTRWDKDNIGNYSVALGYGPLASGNSSVAMGVSPTASGSYSTAFGSMTIASGANSTAFGNAAEASGQWSVAMGNHTTASGANSIAMGKETHAEGENSATIGRNVRAYSFCETVIGSMNTPYTGSKTDWLPNDRLFVIGNGITSASNAMTVLKSGFTGIGTDTPQAGLHIRGTGYPASFMYIEANVGNDAGIRLYEGKTVKWHIFNDVKAAGLQIYNTGGNVAIFAKQSNAFIGLGTTSPTQKLHVVGNAYKTEGGTSWATSSDLRLKTVLGEYGKGLNEITALQPVRFRYLANNPRELSSDIEQVGFVAQEVQKIFPEAVSEAEDGYLDFNIHSINVALVNAIKELKAENDRLKTENREQDSRIERLERLFSASAQNKK